MVVARDAERMNRGGRDKRSPSAGRRGAGGRARSERIAHDRHILAGSRPEINPMCQESVPGRDDLKTEMRPSCRSDDRHRPRTGRPRPGAQGGTGCLFGTSVAE